MIKKILKDNLFYILMEVILIIIFYLLKNSFLYDKITNFDYRILSYRDFIVDEKFTLLFRNLTFLGEYYIPILILVCILLFHNNRWVFLLQGCGYGFAGVVTYISKLIVGRPRPIEALINIPKSFSFPSGHTLTSFVFYMILLYLLSYKQKRKQKLVVEIIAVCLSLLVAFSRVYLGVHYFSDVIGAIMLSIPLLKMNINIYEKNIKEVLKWKH